MQPVLLLYVELHSPAAHVTARRASAAVIELGCTVQPHVLEDVTRPQATPII